MTIDVVDLAQAVYSQKPIGSYPDDHPAVEVWRSMIRTLVSVLEKRNVRFNTAKFLIACGYHENKTV